MIKGIVKHRKKYKNLNVLTQNALIFARAYPKQILYDESADFSFCWKQYFAGRVKIIVI